MNVMTQMSMVEAQGHLEGKASESTNQTNMSSQLASQLTSKVTSQVVASVISEWAFALASPLAAYTCYMRASHT
jgi:hypothetical protein